MGCIGRICLDDTPAMPFWMEYIVFVLYVGLGPCAWILFGIAMFKGRKRMLLVERGGRRWKGAPPRVTILIPAKDEGERIRDCIESVLRQDYPNFSVIAIDDRSTDCTGTIMDELAARNPETLRVVHIQEGTRPEGWTGKCNALHTAVKDAEGEWLLFVDSDVVLQPDALSSTVSLGEDKDCDLVSLLPRLESHSFWESLLVPLAGVRGLDDVPGGADQQQSPQARGVCQRAVSDDPAKRLRRHGRPRTGARPLLRGCGDRAGAQTRRIQDPDFVGGGPGGGADVQLAGRDHARVGPEFFRRERWPARTHFPGDFCFVLLCSFSAYAAIGWGVYRFIHPVNLFRGWGWMGAGVVHGALMTIFLGIMYTWSGNRRSNALFFPLGGAMLLAIFARSLWMCLTGKVEWRGTKYTHRMAAELPQVGQAMARELK